MVSEAIVQDWPESAPNPEEPHKWVEQIRSILGKVAVKSSSPIQHPHSPSSERKVYETHGLAVSHGGRFRSYRYDESAFEFSTESRGVWALGDHLYEVELEFIHRDPKKEKGLRLVRNSRDEEELLNALVEVGFSDQVEQFHKYLERRKENLDEGEHPGFIFETLKAAARFLVENDDLPFSAIKSDFEGNADLEWFLSSRRTEDHEDDMFWGEGDGQIVLRFVSPTLIEFAMLSGPWDDERERLSLSGTMSHSKMKTIVELFTKKLVGYDKE